MAVAMTERPSPPQMMMLQMWQSEPVPHTGPGRWTSSAAHCGPARQLLPVASAARSIVNCRARQEDCYSMDLLHEHWTLLAVYDGHGGPAVAQYCAERLPQLVKSRLQHCLGAHTPQHASWCPSAAAAAPCSSPCEEQVQQALLRAFADCDASLPESDAAEGGSTAVCVLLGPKHIWAANCGDSRAVIARRGQPAVPLTDDHKPERPDEEARIREAGGMVFWNGGHRVMGVLSMSRAMGDLTLKQYGVISTPEIVCVPRTPDDEFVLLASDGLWSHLSSQDAIGLAQECIARAEARGADRTAALRVATQVLIKAAVQQGSSDNITVILCDLAAGAPAAAGMAAAATAAAGVPAQMPAPAGEQVHESVLQPEVPAAREGARVSRCSEDAPVRPVGEVTAGSHVASAAAGPSHGANQPGTAGVSQPRAAAAAATVGAQEPMDADDSSTSSNDSSHEAVSDAPRVLGRSITSPTHSPAHTLPHSPQPRVLSTQLLHLLQLRSLSARARASSQPGASPSRFAPTGKAPTDTATGQAQAATTTVTTGAGRPPLLSLPSAKRSTSEPPSEHCERECPSPTKRTRREAAAPPTLLLPTPDSPCTSPVASPSSACSGAAVLSSPTGLSLRVLCLPHHGGSSSSGGMARQHSGSLLHRSTERLLLAVESPADSPRHAAQ